MHVSLLLVQLAILVISVFHMRGTRPVISINGEVTVTGTGSTTDPFIIT